MIIESLLDLDFYKLTMAQLAWKLHRDVPVTYVSKNRTTRVRLAEIVAEADLRHELDYVRSLRFAPEELAWVAEQGIFEEGFVDFLRDLCLPGYDLAVRDGQYVITVSGPWSEAIWWETLVLAIEAEIYGRACLAARGLAEAGVWVEGNRRLDAKIARLAAMPTATKIIEFGTRRRFGRAWQEHVLRRLAAEIPHLLVGTSNCRLAMQLGLKPVGTVAHEVDMVYSGIHRALDGERLVSHDLALRDWWEMYGECLSIALTDTFGTDCFFRQFSPEQARAWHGLRQDSGEPAEFGERAIAFYAAQGIDPRVKLVVFSDGLDVEAIAALEERFAGRIGRSYGWGTNLTNDLGLPTLSLVMKAVIACGHPLVKLSDTTEKATGPADEVERVKRLAGYAGGLNRECVY